MLAVALTAVIAAVLIVTLSGGGKHSHRARDGAPPARAGTSNVQVAASYLGIPRAQVRERLRKGETLEEIAESTPGHSSRTLLRRLQAARIAELRRRGLTPAQLSEAKARLHARLSTQLRRTRRVGSVLPDASHYLGVTEAQLRAQLRSGHTLAQVAAAHGHTRAQLVASLLAARKARLDVARRRGQLTAAEERAALKLVHKRIEHAVDLRL